ncbi:MAG: N-acetylmuramoyl-L-alanine amidase, partial [Bacteroidia bacterium]
MKKILPVVFLFAFVSSRANDLPVENPYTLQFNKAYALYPSVPKGILEAVAYTQSRFYHLNDNMSQSCIGIPKAYGVMGLIADGKNYFRNNLSKVAALSGFSESKIISDPETNIVAYAAAFNALQQQYNLFSGNAADYSSVLIELSELPMSSDVQNDFVLNTHLYQIYWFLGKSEFQDAYNFPDHRIDLPKLFGTNYKVLSAGSVNMSATSVYSSEGQSYKLNNTNSIMSPDYPPAIWDPTSCNYSSRGSTAISAVAIHDVEGTYAGCISWFKNCSASVSAHYVVRSSDGQITQMVYEADKAWHIGSENPYTLGIEHEGYNNNPSWYTNAMYGTSANLVKDMCTSNGINPLRCYFGPGCSGSTAQCLLGSCTKIKGHQMYPNQTHDDPGPYWNWDKYYKLINNTYSTTTYTSSASNFYDSGGPAGNYGNDERKVWLFTRPAATNITLNFTAFDVEKNYDYLFLYDGGNINSPLIGKYTGTVSPGPVTSTNDSLLVEFRSDCATVATGWAASYTTNVSTASGPDLISPATSVSVAGSWQTAAFTGTISDADNAGGSGVEKGYYQVIDYNGTEWRANYTHGFFADNFDNAIHPEWTQKTGTWTISGNALVQTDETSTAAANTNIYAALTQTLSNRYLYHFLGKFEGSGNSRRAGLHFFCDNPDSSNRNNSYFVWFRLDDQKIQIYKVVNNNFGIPKLDQALAFNAAQWYDIKIIYDRITGKISVYMNDALVATWTDPTPYSNGGYISFRSGNCKFSIDEIKVYRSRTGTVNVSVGSGNTNDIRYQNPNPLTASAKIKSICQDSAQNLSPIFYYDINVDWTPPSNIATVNDGKGSDIAMNCNKDSLSANWTVSGDTNSAVV